MQLFQGALQGRCFDINTGQLDGMCLKCVPCPYMCPCIVLCPYMCPCIVLRPYMCPRCAVSLHVSLHYAGEDICGVGFIDSPIEEFWIRKGMQMNPGGLLRCQVPGAWCVWPCVFVECVRCE